MSLETKIRELMESKKAKALNEAAAGKANDGEQSNPTQGDSQKATVTEIDPFTGGAISADTSIKKGGQEAKQKQGDSKEAEVQDTDAHAAAKTLLTPVSRRVAQKLRHVKATAETQQ